jgi:hypothetical protein
MTRGLAWPVVDMHPDTHSTKPVVAHPQLIHMLLLSILSTPAAARGHVTLHGKVAREPVCA